MRSRLLIPAVLAGCVCACAPAPTEPAEPLAVVREPEATPGPDREALSQAVEEIAEKYEVELGLFLYDGTSHYSAGTLTTMPAWSTVKIPLAFAAEKHCAMDEAYKEQLITWSIEISDNASTDQLWCCLDDPVERVGEEIGSPANIAWGKTSWTLSAQARYAYELSQRDGDAVAERIIGHMKHIDEEQAWGLGTLGVPFKGGWGDVTADGSWHSRQMAFGEFGGVTYGIAVGAISEQGSFQDTIDAIEEVAGLIEAL